MLRPRSVIIWCFGLMEKLSAFGANVVLRVLALTGYPVKRGVSYFYHMSHFFIYNARIIATHGAAVRTWHLG